MRTDTADTAAKIQAYQRKPAPVLTCTPDTADTAEKINVGGQIGNFTQNDPDRHCWPHTGAMNTTELATMTTRLERFARLGLAIDEAEKLADKLQQRDREADDRHACAECANLSGRWRCSSYRQRGATAPGLPADYVGTLTRCNAWRAVA